jgi:hypothetical protein
MKKQTFQQTFLALSVATCLAVPYVQAQTQGTNTPSTPSASSPSTSPGMTNPTNPSSSSTNQPGSSGTTGTRSTPSGTLSGTNDRAVKETDRSLNSQIREALSRHSTLREASNSVVMNTDNGVVTLTGTVATEKEKMDLENELQRISGVSRVENELQIAPRPGNSPTSSSTPIR